jgi:uncharacterized membrane protein
MRYALGPPRLISREFRPSMPLASIVEPTLVAPEEGGACACMPAPEALDNDQAPRSAQLWILRSHCALTPRQLALAMMAVAGVSLLIAAAFWRLGATLVMPFACVETLALTLAYVMYARHAQDRDEVGLAGGLLTVRRRIAQRDQLDEFVAAWVQVVCDAPAGGLIEIRSGGRCVSVGQCLTPTQRMEAARAMQAALRPTNCVSN